jgi:hypothetical protein
LAELWLGSPTAMFGAERKYQVLVFLQVTFQERDGVRGYDTKKLAIMKIFYLTLTRI